VNSRSNRYIVICVFVMAALGCSSPQKKEDSSSQIDSLTEETSNQTDSQSTPAEAQKTSADLIAPGYLFRLSQLEDERLNGKFRVDFDGRLNLPYGVTIFAKDLTLDELRLKVAEAYRPFFKSSAPIEIYLERTSYWIEVRGPVSKPGRFLIKKGGSLDEVLAMAGGFKADAGSVKFLKIVQGKEIKAISLDHYYDSGDISQKLAWKGGDILFFQRELASDEGLTENSIYTKTIKFLGEVRKPGDIGYKKDSDFYYYLAKAGGPTSAADLEKVMLVRGKDYERQAIDFSAESINKMPPIQEGDTLIVYSDRPSSFQKFIQTSATVMTLLTSIAFLVFVL
jgi:protein involved in polysaccharide export with SLBB domain